MAREKEQIAKLKQMVEHEREKVAGYEQISKLHAAYIAILLRKLGATENEPFTITAADVAEAMGLEVRGYPDGTSWKLYVENDNER